jgi:hypothetical protein
MGDSPIGAKSDHIWQRPVADNFRAIRETHPNSHLTPEVPEGPDVDRKPFSRDVAGTLIHRFAR